jgi:Na+/H+ antiporter NhaD/arsenite permease-like protein
MVANDLAALSGAPHIHNIGLIPFVIAALLYFLATNPRDVIARVDWGTILFFATMFIAMKAVWDGGVLQPLIAAVLPTYQGTAADLLAITALSLALSQVLSNAKKVTVVEYFFSRTSSIMMLEAAPSNVRLPATVLAMAKTSQALSLAPTWVR